MRSHRLSRLLLTLLLAASLPLRAHAAFAPCAPPSVTRADPHALAIAHAAHHGMHCEHGSRSGHGPGCNCCCIAAGAAAPGWALPHDPAAAACARLLRHAPVLTLDRLDRPPRLPV